MRKTPLGCTILEGHDVADLPLVSENAEILELELAKKVAAAAGKGLSTNDYTTAEKTKLIGIATGANNYVHPTTHPASMIMESVDKRFMKDLERTKISETFTHGTYTGTGGEALRNIVIGFEPKLVIIRGRVGGTNDHSGFILNGFTGGFGNLIDIVMTTYSDGFKVTNDPSYLKFNKSGIEYEWFAFK